MQASSKQRIRRGDLDGSWIDLNRHHDRDGDDDNGGDNDNDNDNNTTTDENDVNFRFLSQQLDGFSSPRHLHEFLLSGSLSNLFALSPDRPATTSSNSSSRMSKSWTTDDSTTSTSSSSSTTPAPAPSSSSCHFVLLSTAAAILVASLSFTAGFALGSRANPAASLRIHHLVK